MSYQPLHHKYRPQTFADLVGQEAIATTLTHALQQQRIAPAYLFTGARGTGKTSSARILAKSLNCLKQVQPTEKPCGQCEACRAIANGSALDVIEIDAASNTGVDNIRELIERAQFAPVQCRYKVYVIDEVHMLSNAAFNALLKTLEEPPDRVVFVLATTDPQRVLPTIISRCQRFDFRRIPLDAMVQHLRTIADKEKIAITDDALTLVAQLSQGGLRDAESTLDQLSLLAGEVTVERVWDLVGSVPERDLLSLLEAIAADNPEALLESTRRLLDRGREPLIVLQNLASFYRDLLIAKTAPERGDLVAMTAVTWTALCQFAQSLPITTILEGQKQLRQAEVQLKSTTQPRLWLEITLMGLLPSAIASAIVQPQTVQQSITQTRQTPRVQAPTTGNGKQSPTSPQGRSTSPPSEIGMATRNKAGEAARPLPQKLEEDTEEPISTLAEISAPQNEAAPAENTTPAESENEAAAGGSLSQIWQQIIAHLHPLSKALLNEHGQLLGFDGQEVLIGISTTNLVKIAQGKIKDIEKAFEDVFHQKVRVSLEVAAPGTPRAQTVQAPPPPAKEPPPAADPKRSRKTSGNGASVSESPASQFANPPASTSAASSHPVEVTQSAKMAEPSAVVSPNSWEEDVAARAARQLAEFFGGKVVDLSDAEEGAGTPLEEGIPATTLAETTLTEGLGGADEETDDNDSDDVPF
jgi:DNA polymerase-3 subunit gamma/tau